MAELNYSLKQDGNVVKKGTVTEGVDRSLSLIEVPSENECGTTFELEVTYKTQGFEEDFQNSIKKNIDRTTPKTDTSPKVTDSEIIVTKDFCLKVTDSEIIV